MAKSFNVNGACNPDRHYMVDLTSRLQEIRAMIEQGEYFTINRARQYGKTTILHALTEYLADNYEVIFLDFQFMSSLVFENEQSFVAAFSEELLDNCANFPEEVKSRLTAFADRTAKINSLQALFKVLQLWCSKTDHNLVLIIDEADTATNNQIFMDFLAQLRAYYLKRSKIRTFQSVILAGVYDIRNIRHKIRAEDEHKTNSPWNIAAKFRVDMSFSENEIAGMLTEYEDDYHTGMNINTMAALIYSYTSGYPYLVSALCKNLDEEVSNSPGFPGKNTAWTKNGFLEAEKILLTEKNSLFETLLNKVTDYPDLRKVIYDLLFTGRTIPYSPWNRSIESAEMFGFVRNNGGNTVISNRIFEAILYNYFISEEYVTSKMYDVGLQHKNQFITNGHLNMRLILEKFVETFDYLYGDQEETFLEDAGRRYFMLFLKPIINGVGNTYVEAQTRNQERMDLVIDYQGDQFIIEMKVWRGNTYHERGEEQLIAYLDYYHLNKGYMLSFNFNKKKETGVKDVILGDKLLIEAIV